MSELKQREYVACRRGGDGVSATSWVCGKRNDSAGVWAAVGNRGDTILSRNVEQGFLVPFLCWRLFERAGFAERGMGLSGRIRSELEVPAEQCVCLCVLLYTCMLVTWRGRDIIFPWGWSYRGCEPCYAQIREVPAKANKETETHM